MSEMKLREEIPKLTWAQIYDTIVKALNLDISQETAQFQFASGNLEADWKDNDYSCFIRANAAPMDIGAYYNPNSSSLDKDYGSFIIDIAPSDPLKDPHYLDLKKSYDLATENRRQEFDKAQSNFDAWKKNNPDHTTEYPDIKNIYNWLESPFGTEYKKTIDTLDAQLAGYSEDLKKYGSDPDLQKLVNDYNNDDYQSSVATSWTKSIKVRITEIRPSLNEKITAWRNLTTPTFVFDTKTATSDENAWKISGDVSVNYTDFFGIYTKVGGFVYYDVRRDQSFQLMIKAIAIQNFDISRDGWFDERALDTYYAGPFLDNRITTKSFFGSKEGCLKLIPTMILVGYGITASITVSDKIYSTIKTSLEESIGVQIGPFKINVNSSQSMVTTHNLDQTTTIEFTTPNNTAQIIGVLSKLHIHDA